MNTIKRFRTDERGGVAIMFGLAIIPLLGMVGAAIDYGRASLVRTHMQKAVDGTALALVARSRGLSDTQLAKAGEETFKAMMAADPWASAHSVKVTRGNNTIDVSATGTVKTALMQVMGLETMDIGARGSAAWGGKKIELALVLDNTGSMRESNKLDELKKAVRGMLENARGDLAAGTLKISLVPFNTQVNVGRVSHSGIEFDSRERVAFTRTVPSTSPDWKGCITDREQPYDVSPLSGPRHIAIKCLKERDSAPDLAPILPLTSNYDALDAATKRMSADGWTNITIGVAHGLTTLTPANMHGGEPAAFDDSTVEKFMIVLTDGDNTRNRLTDKEKDINERTRLACDAAKQQVVDPRNPAVKAAKPVRVYTILVMEGNEKLLQDCASLSPATQKKLYFFVRNATGIDDVFRSIFDEIRRTRLTA